MASPRQWRDRLQPQPHLEDGSAYRQLRPTRLDEIKNFHSTDTIDTKNSGTRGRSIWVHSSRVGKTDSQVGVSLRSRGTVRFFSGGPVLTVGRTVFEMWLGNL